MLQRVLAEVDYRLDVCNVTNGGHIEHSCGKEGGGRENWIISLSICRSIFAIFPAIQVYWFYEIRQGIMNSHVYTYLGVSLYVSLLVCICVWNYTRTHACAYVCKYVCVYECMFVCMCVSLYAYEFPCAGVCPASATPRKTVVSTLIYKWLLV